MQTTLHEQVRDPGALNHEYPAKAIRVLVAHSNFTHTYIDVLSKRIACYLNALADRLLHECDRRFSIWYESLCTS